MVTVSKATMPALATEIAAAFPELMGRVIVVSDASITPENMPTLPICILALLNVVPIKGKSTTKRPALQERFVIEFWFKPDKYKRTDGGESPFWAFYDYDAVQERLLTITSDWISPRGSRIMWLQTDLESNEFATTVSFRFEHEYYHCDYEPPVDCNTPPDPFPDGQPFVLGVTVTIPCSEYCEPLPEEPADPCATPDPTS